MNGIENWLSDPDTCTKHKDFILLCNHLNLFIIAFLLAKKCLETSRPIATKLQRSNIDSFQAIDMIDSTIEQINIIRSDLEVYFNECFTEASQLVESVGGMVSRPRIPRRQVYRNNAPSETPEDYYRKNLAIPFLHHLLN